MVRGHRLSQSNLSHLLKPHQVLILKVQASASTGMTYQPFTGSLTQEKPIFSNANSQQDNDLDYPESRIRTCPKQLSEHKSGKEGKLSDSSYKPERNKEMNYWETVQSVRAFLGRHLIPNL